MNKRMRLDGVFRFIPIEKHRKYKKKTKKNNRINRYALAMNARNKPSNSTNNNTNGMELYVRRYILVKTVVLSFSLCTL